MNQELSTLYQNKPSSFHNSHREYTFAPNSDYSKTSSQIKLPPPTNYTKKKSPSQSISYLSKLKQQYAPLQSTQSTHHSQHNQSVESEYQNYEQLLVYNNLLKIELEKKLFNQGVFVIKQNNGKCVDFYIELQKQKENYEKQIQHYQSIIQNYENNYKQLTDLQDFQIQNHNLTKSIEEAIKKLNLAHQTISQLEQEKESLLDYIDKQKEISEQQNQENNQHTIKQKEMKTIINQLQKQIESYNNELMEKEEFITQINQVQNKSVTLLQDELIKYQQQITELQKQLQDQEHQNLSRKFNDSVSQIPLNFRQSEDKQSRIQFTQENHSVCEFESNVKSSRNTNLIQKQQQGLDQIIKINKQTLQDYQQQLVLHQKLGEFQEKLSSQLLLIEQQNKQIIQYQQQQIELITENQQYKLQETQINNQLRELQQNNIQIKQENEQLQEQVEQLSQQIIDQNQINQDLNKKYYEAIDQIQNSKQQNTNQSDVEYYENIISDFNIQLTKIQKKLDSILTKYIQDHSKTIEISSNSILRLLDNLDQILQKNQTIQIHNLTTIQTPTNQGQNYFSNEFLESNQKNSIISNYSNYSKPYLVKRNYYL